MILSGQKFASIADYVYAETVATENRKTKDVIYPLNKNILQDGDIIYCKTDYIYQLFSLLKDLKITIKIITSESDYEINKEIFQKKLDCIEKWFAINVNYEHEDLIPIPLGIANDYSHTSLKFEKIEQTSSDNKKMLYINHNNWTNTRVRKPIYDMFKTNEWCTVENPGLSLSDFKNRIDSHHYMICPQGNGLDTHRMWECLYNGTFPIVKNHITHKNLEDLPILFVDDFSKITENFLSDNLEKMKCKTREKLDLKWWEEFIKNERR